MCRKGCVAGGPSPCPLCLLFWHQSCSETLMKDLEKRTARIPHLDESLEDLLKVVASATEPVLKLPTWILSVLDGDQNSGSESQPANADAAPSASSTSSGSSRPPWWWGW